MKLKSLVLGAATLAPFCRRGICGVPPSMRSPSWCLLPLAAVPTCRPVSWPSSLKRKLGQSVIVTNVGRCRRNRGRDPTRRF